MPFETSTTNAAAFLNHFGARRDRLLSLARALCEAESPSGDAEGSRAVVNLLEDAARGLEGFASFERTPAPDGFGEHFRLRAFAEGAREEKTLLLLGHTDTVHPRGTLAARPWREEGGRIYAPGVFDMKAACAAALESLRACVGLGTRPR